MINFRVKGVGVKKAYDGPCIPKEEQDEGQMEVMEEGNADADDTKPIKDEL